MINFPYNIICVDTETTSLSFVDGDIIELSLYSINNEVQKTWCIKPTNYEAISMDALRVNGHKLEDLKHETKYGKETYQDPKKVIVEIENWMMELGCTREETCLVGHNVGFDKTMMEQFWKKCGSEDSFPFGRRVLDTMQFEILLDIASENKRDSYSLASTIKKYGIKNDKAHTAAADTKVTKEVFVKQIEYLASLLKK